MSENAPQMQKATVHLKYTGTELICDIVEWNEENLAITVKDPATLQMIGNDGQSAQMGLVPFLMTAKDNVIHLSLQDILFIADTKEEIAQQHTNMFSPIDLPDTKIIT